MKKLLVMVWNNYATRKLVKRLLLSLLRGAAASSKTKIDDAVVDAVQEILDEE